MVTPVSVILGDNKKTRVLPQRRKVLVGVDNLVQLLVCIQVMFKGHGSFGGGDDVNVAFLCTTDPISEFLCIWNCG